VHASRDTLRVVLRSSDALVAPTSLRAAGNGLYRAEIVLPSTSIDAGPFSITVYIIHVDGQGLEDPPPHPFMEPIMLLAARHPGPPGYNIPVLLPLAISVAEPAAAGALDATGAHRGPTPLLFDAADVPDVAVEAATPLPRTASVGLGRHRVVSGPGSARRRPTELPLCVDGRTHGRWVLQRRLYRMVPNEPLGWEPFGCRWSWYTGARLRQCLTAPHRLGGVKLVGESTLGQLYEAMLLHVNTSSFHWQTHFPDPTLPTAGRGRLAYGLEAHLSAGGATAAFPGHGEYHGLPAILESLGRELRERPAGSIVLLEGANDAARDSIGAFEIRLQALVQLLLQAKAQGWWRPPHTLIYVRPPTRHYKLGAGAGGAACLNGSAGSGCWTAEQVEALEGVEWRNVPPRHWEARNGQPPPFNEFRSFGTSPRRAHLAALVESQLGGAGLLSAVLDYEALTAALPADYCIDGEHWGCPAVAWWNRHLQAYQCRGLANVIMANILANLLCNNSSRRLAHMRRFQPRPDGDLPARARART